MDGGLIAGIIIILMGIVGMFPGFIKGNILFGNMMSGTKTKISKQTIAANQIIAMIAILIGIFIIFFSMSSPGDELRNNYDLSNYEFMSPEPLTPAK